MESVQSTYEKLKIRDLEVGRKITSLFGVVSCEIKQAKNQKNYLEFTLTDGETTINAKRWDYQGAVAPPSNSVINVTATVGEWLGQAQLTIHTGNVVEEVPLSDFMITGDFSIDEYWTKATALISGVSNKEMHDILVDIFAEHKEQLLIQPGAKSIHHAYKAGLLQHLVDVTQTAVSLLQPFVGSYSRDLVVAGGLLHDIGKLKAYEMNGLSIDFAEEGHMHDHILSGVMMLEEYSEAYPTATRLIKHIIGSHHGQIAWGSPVTPRFMEAWAVHFADLANSRLQTIVELNKQSAGNKMTKKEWTLENREQYTQDYIRGLLE